VKALETHYLALQAEEREDWRLKLEEKPELAVLELRKCAGDPWYFLTGWGKTLDQHGEPVKPFPAKDYLRLLARRFLEKDLLIVYKSRQMMVSWLMSALCLWETLFHSGKLVVLQTKKADAADNLIKRAHFIWKNLPEFFRGFAPANPQKKGAHLYGRLEIPKFNSELMGIPEGTDQIRQYTASRVWEDEFQLQDKGREILEAVHPTIVGGGKIVLTGTAKPGFMKELVRDDIAETSPRELTGLREWKNRLGYHIVELHYTADPDKDPAMLKGRGWVEAAKVGQTAEGWEREYEINDEITPGDKFFKEFDRGLHIGGFKYDPQTPVLRGWDFGFHYPALVVGQFDKDDRLWILGSFRLEELVFDDFLKEALEWCGKNFPAEKYCDFIDPAGFQRTHHNPLTDADVMNRAGLFPSGKRVMEDKAARQFRLLLAPRKDRTPGLMVEEGASEMISLFLQGLTFPEKAAGAKGESGEGPQELHPWIDLWDAMKYLAAGVMNPLNLKPATGYLTAPKQEKQRARRLAEKRERERWWAGW